MIFIFLKKLVEQGRAAFYQEFSSWEKAISASYVPLIEDGTVEMCYVDSVIQCVKTMGPYIVIAPNIAMPHFAENADCVHGTAISFMHLEQPVHFTDGDADNDARLFFSLASCNSEQHMENMRQLSDILCVDGITELLLGCKDTNDLLRLDEQLNL